MLIFNFFQSKFYRHSKISSDTGDSRWFDSKVFKINFGGKKFHFQIRIKSFSKLQPHSHIQVVKHSETSNNSRFFISKDKSSFLDLLQIQHQNSYEGHFGGDFEIENTKNIEFN